MTKSIPKSLQGADHELFSWCAAGEAAVCAGPGVGIKIGWNEGADGSWWELMGVEHSWTVGKAILLLWRSVFWSLESLDMAVPAPLISCGSPEGPAGTWAKSLPLAVKSVGPGSEGEGLGARPEAGWDLDTCGHWVAWWTNFRCAECKRYLRYQWYDVIWRDMMWYMTWYDVIWCDMIWYDMICLVWF